MRLPTVCPRPVAHPARVITALAFVALLMLPARPVLAQAWVPPAGAGSITFAFQAIDNTGHRLDDGSLDPGAKSTDVGLYFEGEYALTDRFSVAAGIPYIFARFRGPEPTPLDLPVDSCRCWHSGWQDFGFTARYNLVNGAFALTPSVAYGVPSHAYNYEGEAVVGRRLQEVRVAVDAGRRLDGISPKLSVQGRYSYAFVEKVLDVPNNRSNAALTGSFQMTRRFSLRGTALWQHTHGGLRVPTDSHVARVHPPARPAPAGQQLATGCRVLLLLVTTGCVRVVHRVHGRGEHPYRQGLHGGPQLAVRPAVRRCDVESSIPTGYWLLNTGYCRRLLASCFLLLASSLRTAKTRSPPCGPSGRC